MQSNLVIDIGNTKIKAASFVEDSLVDQISYVLEDHPLNKVSSFLLKHPYEAILLASVNDLEKKNITELLNHHHLAYYELDYRNLELVLEVEEPDQVGQDRIANAYGALHHFPKNDCIIVDIGTAVTFDFVTKEGRYQGGAIMPGMELGAAALAEHTHLLPIVTPKKPKTPLAKTTETHIQSGLYYGLLGGIERLIFELKQQTPSPSSVQVIATGGATQKHQDTASFVSDLGELVDSIDPHLTLVGLHEILKEYTRKKKEK